MQKYPNDSKVRVSGYSVPFRIEHYHVGTKRVWGYFYPYVEGGEVRTSCVEESEIVGFWDGLTLKLNPL